MPQVPDYSLSVGGIDEIAPGFVESIQQRKALFLAHASHAKLVPFVAYAHGAETDRGDMEASDGG